MYFGEIWNFHNFKCSNISAFISFHNEKNYIFGISITCRFQKKYFQPPLNFFIFHHPLRRLFRWLSDTYMKKKLYICDQHPLRVSLNFFQKFFFQSPSPLNVDDVMSKKMENVLIGNYETGIVCLPSKSKAILLRNMGEMDAVGNRRGCDCSGNSRSDYCWCLQEK